MERRNFIKTAVTVVAMVGLPSLVLAESTQKVLKSANQMSLDKAIELIVGESKVEQSNKIKLTTPSIAENAATVPVKVEVNYPMEKENYVKSIHIVSTENANARTIDFFLTPANAEASIKTNIKLSKSQKVMIVVGLSNGTFLKTEKFIKVSLSGC